MSPSGLDPRCPLETAAQQLLSPIDRAGNPDLGCLSRLVEGSRQTAPLAVRHDHGTDRTIRMRLRLSRPPLVRWPNTSTVSVRPRWGQYVPGTAGTYSARAGCLSTKVAIYRCLDVWLSAMRLVGPSCPRIAPPVHSLARLPARGRLAVLTPALADGRRTRVPAEDPFVLWIFGGHPSGPSQQTYQVSILRHDGPPGHKLVLVPERVQRQSPAVVQLTRTQARELSTALPTDLRRPADPMLGSFLSAAPSGVCSPAVSPSTVRAAGRRPS